MEVALTGDSAETLRELLPLLKQKTRSRLAFADEKAPFATRAPKRSARRSLKHRRSIRSVPLYELSRRLPDKCIITSDSSSVVIWAARHLQLRRGMMMSVSGGLATMGSALPYALAAKFAYPDRVVIATAGDGAMQMSGNSGAHRRR